MCAFKLVAKVWFLSSVQGGVGLNRVEGGSFALNLLEFGELRFPALSFPDAEVLVSRCVCSVEAFLPNVSTYGYIFTLIAFGIKHYFVVSRNPQHTCRRVCVITAV